MSDDDDDDGGGGGGGGGSSDDDGGGGGSSNDGGTPLFPMGGLVYTPPRAGREAEEEEETSAKKAEEAKSDGNATDAGSRPSSRQASFSHSQGLPQQLSRATALELFARDQHLARQTTEGTDAPVAAYLQQQQQQYYPTEQSQHAHTAPVSLGYAVQGHAQTHAQVQAQRQQAQQQMYGRHQYQYTHGQHQQHQQQTYPPAPAYTSFASAPASTSARYTVHDEESSADGYGGNGGADDDDDDDGAGAPMPSGRPSRRAATQKKISYEEDSDSHSSDSESKDFSDDDEDDDSEEEADDDSSEASDDSSENNGDDGDDGDEQDVIILGGERVSLPNGYLKTRKRKDGVEYGAAFTFLGTELFFGASYPTKKKAEEALKMGRMLFREEVEKTPNVSKDELKPDLKRIAKIVRMKCQDGEYLSLFCNHSFPQAPFHAKFLLLLASFLFCVFSWGCAGRATSSCTWKGNTEERPHYWKGYTYHHHCSYGFLQEYSHEKNGYSRGSRENVKTAERSHPKATPRSSRPTR